MRKVIRPNSHWFVTSDVDRKRFGDKVLSVAVTPNGYADAINGNFFALPEERKMPFAKFLDIIEEPTKHNGKIHADAWA